MIIRSYIQCNFEQTEFFSNHSINYADDTSVSVIFYDCEKEDSWKNKNN